ncbi:MAG: NAD(P)H-dependent oxidoreductase subunit E [Saprospirales bacterium]|nr:NAD(P)H-dependent oxidoreductase subunit E [Saprospirales bacterium]
MMQRWQLLDELWRIQDAHGFLPDGEINALSNKLGISMVELEGVISFYHFFQRKPSGKFTIYLNNSIIADMNGRQAVKEAFEQATNCKWGCVDDTCTFGLFDTSCIGMSDQEPAALINFHPFTNLTPEKVNRIVKQLRWGAPVEELADQVNSEVRFKPDHERTVLLRDFKPGSIVGRLPEMSSDQVLEVLGESKLSGRGGADFPVSLKWKTCRSYETGPKYVVCNADEGEPGTFKDRFLLMNYPGLVFEGMIMAGFVIRAKEGVLYLRGEYKFMKPALEKVLAEYRANSWLGKSVAGIADFDFDIRIQLGAGAYICGEETALLESMEGKRGESRVKIFFPAEKGFLGKPTIINNVETFATAARILELGAPYFNRLGTAKSKGTRLLSISGDCELPGIYEVEWGITIGQILGLCGAKDTFFMQASGPAGMLLNPTTQWERRLSFDDVPCNGSFMVFDKTRCMLSTLRNFSEFFKHESCGVCTPCRAGNFILSRKIEKFQNGLGIPSDMEDMANWGAIMKMTCRCGLGRTAPNALVDAMLRFPHVFDRHMVKDISPLEKGFDLAKAVEAYERATEYERS